MEPKILDMTHANDVIRIQGNGTVPTLQHRMGTGGNQVPLVFEQERGANEQMSDMEVMTLQGDPVAGTLKARDYKGVGRYDSLGSAVCITESDKTVYALDRASFNQGKNAQYNFEVSEDGINSPLVARGPSAVAYWNNEETSGTLTANNAGGNQRMPDKDHFHGVVDTVRHIVRRLTPVECARLQGFPDWWGELSEIEDMSDEDYEFWKEVLKTHAEINGKPYREKTKAQMISFYNKLHTDSAEYKMWGNGIALPCARVPLHGMAQHGAKTLGSLFDGSGGFPLAASLDGIQTLWTSEIEPYCIAVTKERFHATKTSQEEERKET